MADKQTTANDVSADEELKAVANDHDFWHADWGFVVIVALMSAGVFAGTSMYYNYGVGAFNEVAIVAMLKAGMTGGSILTGVGIGIPAILLSVGAKSLVSNFGLALLTGGVLGLIIGVIIYLVRKFTINQSNATFGADVMMGAGNQTGRFLGPLIILSAVTASIPIGIGSTVGAALFYAWKKPIPGGAIIGAMVMGFFFPVKL